MSSVCCQLPSSFCVSCGKTKIGYSPVLPIRRGGLFVIVMNRTYYQSGNFESAFRKMQDDGLWSIQKLEEFNYMTELVRPGMLLVAAKR